MRRFALVLMLILMIGLCSCSFEADYPLTVSSTGINDEIFSYYMDCALSENPEYTSSQTIDATTEKCIRYVSVNTTFYDCGLSLTPAEENEVSEKLNALWDVFGAYYESAGISKETLYKIQLNKEYTEKLRLYYYDTDGISPIDDEVLKEYFSENYVAFKLIKGYLYTSDVYGNTIEYTDEEKEAIYERFNHAVEQIDNGTSIEIMYSSLAETQQIIEQTLSSQVIADGDLHYPQGFYNAVKKLDEGSAGLCIFDDYIYLIYRVELLQTDDLFEDYRYICLEKVSEEPLQSRINIMCNDYTSVRNTKKAEKCYKEILKVRENG